MWDAYYGLNTTNLVMWLVDDAAATRAANNIWRSIFLYVCVLRNDIDLTDKSFHARVNPQKTSKEKYDNKTSFRSLLWIKEEKMSNHITKEWSDECKCAYVIHISLLMSVVGWCFCNTKERKHHITSDLWQKVSPFSSQRSRCYFISSTLKR